MIYGTLVFWSLIYVNCVLYSAPEIKLFKYNLRSKDRAEQYLRSVRKTGGVCLTSYGTIDNSTNQLAVDDRRRDYIWVFNARSRRTAEQILHYV